MRSITIMQKKFRMSQKKYDELRAELEYMKTVREKEVADQVKEARSFGDLSENSEYDEAKTEQAKVEARILELDEMLKNIRIIIATRIYQHTIFKKNAFIIFPFSHLSKVISPDNQCEFTLRIFSFQFIQCFNCIIWW